MRTTSSLPESVTHKDPNASTMRGDVDGELIDEISRRALEVQHRADMARVADADEHAVAGHLEGDHLDRVRH